MVDGGFKKISWSGTMLQTARYRCPTLALMQGDYVAATTLSGPVHDHHHETGGCEHAWAAPRP